MLETGGTRCRVYFRRWRMRMLCVVVRGLVKLQKIQKSEKYSDWSDATHPLPCPFFWKYLETWKQHKNTNKTQNYQKIIKIRVGAWPTHPLPSFSRIFWFFKLDKTPLNSIYCSFVFYNLQYNRPLTSNAFIFLGVGQIDTWYNTI